LLIVGTHVGALLIPLARLAREVVGIEANPETFELLKMNLALNGISNARVLSLAASDKRGDLEFLLSRTNSGGSKIRPAVERQEFVYDDPKIATVNAARLDDVLCGQSFDLVLMDIEGSEYFALLGMQNILAEARNLVIELLPNHIENVAGISAEQFLKAIPESFRYARFIGEDTGEVMSRAQLSELLPALWKRNYFRGWDIRFSTDRL
jgi:FkbM family methyltransferase